MIGSRKAVFAPCALSAPTHGVDINTAHTSLITTASSSRVPINSCFTPSLGYSFPSSPCPYMALGRGDALSQGCQPQAMCQGGFTLGVQAEDKARYEGRK